MGRALLIVAIAACAACSGRDAMHPTQPPGAGSAAAAQGIRLPDNLAPLRYDLRLELDPDRDGFRGSVAIRAHLTAPAEQFWIHADDLEITSARSDAGALVQLPLAGDQMRAFGFGHKQPAGDVTLRFEFTGASTHDEEGLFRQNAGNRWYLFSQGESVFARRILPCFDEPRFKVPWRVTLVVPGDLVALSNMPQASEQQLPDGRREVTFAETPPMPSYLLAVAVGPFELVDAGTVGRNHVPVRVAALQGDRARTGIAAAKLPAIVDALEDYLDRPLPLAKLDLVAVPHLFGAMENPGLVTFDTGMLVGDADRKGFRNAFVHVAAHELAHQWFGNLVTPAWWDDLWLSEAFASWLSDKVADKLGAFDDPVLRAALQREQALEADAEPDAAPLRHAVLRNDDPDEGFDTIAYDKGASVLATLERWIGEPAMRDALRRYITDRANTAATTADLVAAITAASKPEVGRVLETYVDRAGAPIVELSITCDARPRIVAQVRGGAATPICIRYGTSHGPARTCGVVDKRTELPVGECPAWVWGLDGAGYYHVAAGATARLDLLDPAERIALADDIAAGFARGDVPIEAALTELAQLARTDDPYAVHGAAAIAQVIDPLVTGDTRAAWTSWLATRFAARLTSRAFLSPGTAADRRVRDDLIALVPERVPAQVAKLARGLVDADVAHSRAPDPDLVLLGGGDRTLFDALARLAREAKQTEVREAAMEALGTFGPAFVDGALDAFLASDLPADRAWGAVEGYFGRPATRDAAWQAVRTRLPALLAHVSGTQAPMFVEATASLCDAKLRAEVAATFEPHLPDIYDGRRALDRVLARIDRCTALRARAGDLASSLK